MENFDKEGEGEGGSRFPLRLAYGIEHFLMTLPRARGAGYLVAIV